MNVTFKEAAPVVRAVEKKIVIAERVVGRIEEDDSKSEAYRFHAIINIPSIIAGLLQGYGATEEKAILDALTNGRLKSQNILKYVEDLETALGVEEVAT